MREKICIFNFGGLFWILLIAVCSSLLISLDVSSQGGEEITNVEMIRAFICGAVSVGGFFTRQKVEQKEEE